MEQKTSRIKFSLRSLFIILITIIITLHFSYLAIKKGEIEIVYRNILENAEVKFISVEDEIREKNCELIPDYCKNILREPLSSFKTRGLILGRKGLFIRLFKPQSIHTFEGLKDSCKKNILLKLFNELKTRDSINCIKVGYAFKDGAKSIKEEIPEFIKELRTIDNYWIKNNIIIFLGFIGPPAQEAVPTLIEFLDNKLLLYSSIWALGEIDRKEKESVAFLIKKLKHQQRLLSINLEEKQEYLNSLNGGRLPRFTEEERKKFGGDLATSSLTLRYDYSDIQIKIIQKNSKWRCSMGSGNTYLFKKEKNKLNIYYATIQEFASIALKKITGKNYAIK